MQNKLILAIGNIASGKSTWCKDQASKGVIVVSDDDIKTALHGGIYHYDPTCKQIYKSVEIAIVTAALTAGKTVVIDRPNHTKAQRRKWIGIAQTFDVESYAILFDFDEPHVHARRRFKANSRGVSYERWLKIAKNFNDTYEEPCVGEGIQHVLHVEDIYDEGI